MNDAQQHPYQLRRIRRVVQSIVDSVLELDTYQAYSLGQRERARRLGFALPQQPEMAF